MEFLVKQILKANRVTLTLMVGLISLPTIISSQIYNFWGEGSMAVSCAPQHFNLTTETYDDGHVVGIIDVRKTCDFNKLGIWPDSGEVYPNKFYYQAGNAWKFSNLGMVFPLAVDEFGNIYVGATSTYGSVTFPDGIFPNGQRGSGSIHKIDGRTGNCDTNFVNTRQSTSFNPIFPTSMPNKTVITDKWGYDLEYPAKSGPGLGDLAYNRYHKFLYASNFEDGNIYKIDPNSGNILNLYDPRFGDNSSSGIDNGAEGFVPRGQRPWAIGIKKEGNSIKLYYSNWKVDSRDTFPENSKFNEIWSVELDLVGNPIPITEKLEISIPHLSLNHPERPFHNSSNPISDMDFSKNGVMYLSERGMDHEYGRNVIIVWDTATGKLIPNPRNQMNHARILRYNQAGSNWNLHVNDKFYELGHDITSNRSVNASGGISVGDYYCKGNYSKDSLVYASGSFDDVTPNAYVYGVLGMETNIGDHENHIYIDFDSQVASRKGETSPKPTPGDPEIWEGISGFNLACDDMINVSLDEDCCATITYDLLVENDFPKNCLVIQLKDLKGNNIPTSPKVCNQFVDQIINYIIKDTCYGNSCWGQIKLEQKTAPDNPCQDNDTILCLNRNYNWKPPVILDHCGNLAKFVLLADETVKQDCNQPCVAIRTITYYYEDIYGNKSNACTKVICFRKIEKRDVIMPRDTILPCKDWPSSPPPSVTGVPMAGGNSLFPDWYLCKVAVTYKDEVLSTCSGSYKILRTWTMIDWCKTSPENVMKYTQLIKVLDEVGPKIKCPTDQTIFTSITNCEGTINISVPEIIQECSSVSYNINYKISDANGNPSSDGTSLSNISKTSHSTYQIKGLPIGTNWIEYTVTDDCGNPSWCSTIIQVVDNIPPIPICDQKTIISLNELGYGKIDALSLDDGSIDNCRIKLFEAKRMDDGSPCHSNNAYYFQNYVEFCCNDVGHDKQVLLRVTDESGNYNTCMVEVEVQDKVPPIINCPPNISVSCQYEYSDLNKFGTVRYSSVLREPIAIQDTWVEYSGPAVDGYANDACNFTIEELETQYDLRCGQGNIYRSWQATDISGLSSNCVQTISIVNHNKEDINISWPSDIYSTTMCNRTIDVDPVFTGEPIVSGYGPCNNILINYEDKTYTSEPDACYKILRMWTIIDWCIYEPNNQNSEGIWTKVQIIKIINNSAPKFTSNCSDRILKSYGNDCEELFELRASAEDDCTDSTDLTWEHVVDLYNDGFVNLDELKFSGNGNYIIGYLPNGIHKVIFTVRDRCNNINQCEFLVTIIDGKEPTPICRTGIITTIMPSSKTIEIWAKDFNLYSSDNCTESEKLKIYFEINKSKVPKAELDCAHIGTNTFRMYVEDETGNRDYCDVQLELQDPNQVCGHSYHAITGSIRTPMGAKLSKFEVISTNSNNTNSVLTDNNGQYSFTDLIHNYNYKIKPIHNLNYLHGVSTLDLVVIQKHILGKQPFSNEYQYLAADANNSSSITSADISEIRKLILGIKEEFTNNDSWRFIDSDFKVENANSPFPFKEDRSYNPINSSMSNQDFIAIKVGDVTGDGLYEYESYNSERSRKNQVIYFINKYFDSQEIFEIPFYVEDKIVINGIQLCINIGNNLEFIDFISEELLINNTEYHLINNQLKISYAAKSTQEVNKKSILFKLRFKSKQTGDLMTQLNLSDETIRNEYYDNNLTPHTINFRIEDSIQLDNYSKGKSITLTPNPFYDRIELSFYNELEDEITFEIIDLNGRIIYSKIKTYLRGNIIESINLEKQIHDGVYFLRIKSASSRIINTLRMVKYSG